MTSRLRNGAVYAAILATIVSGLLQSSAWSAVAASCVLAMIGLVRPRAPVGMALSGPVGPGDGAVIAGAMLNAAAVASGAYLYGRVCGWMLGF